MSGPAQKWRADFLKFRGDCPLQLRYPANCTARQTGDAAARLVSMVLNAQFIIRRVLLAMGGVRQAAVVLRLAITVIASFIADGFLFVILVKSLMARRGLKIRFRNSDT
jgi:hypothetical protein